MLDGLRFALAHLLVLVPLLLIPWFRRWSVSHQRALMALVVIAMVSVLPQVLSVGYLMLTTPNFTVTESEVAFQAVAELINQGRPAYPAVSSDTIYGLLYGPIAYLPFQLIFAFSDSLITPKAICTLLTAAYILLLIKLTRSIREANHAPLALAGFAILMGPVLPLLMNPKSDVFLALFATVPWLARHRPQFIWIVAVCMGLSVGMKITAVVLFIPHLTYAALYGKRKPGTIAASIAASAAISMIPFFHSAYSLRGYLEILSIASKHELVPIGIWMTMLLLLPITLPLLRMTRDSSRDRKALLLGLAVLTAFALNIPAATKLGSGLYHYYPWIPSVLIWLGVLRQSPRHSSHDSAMQRVPMSLVSAYCIIAFTVLTFTIAATPSRINKAQYVAFESKKFNEAISKVQPPFGVVSGASSFFGDADFRADIHLLEVIRSGGTLQIGSFAMLDLWGGGKTPSISLLESFERCTVPRYLGYADQKPWQTWAIYADRLMPGQTLEDPRTNVFGPELSRVFLAHYQREPLTPGYELWTCSQSEQPKVTAPQPESTKA